MNRISKNRIDRTLIDKDMATHKLSNNDNSRRNFVKGAAAGWLLVNTIGNSAMASSNLFASPKVSKQKKVVWIFLRGALDSLHTVIPIADPNLHSLRNSILAPIKEKLLTIDGGFALHPDLPFLHKLYKKKQMSPVVAVASGYRSRSHFDAQDQMESGLNTTEHENGWLARALNQVQGNGVAIARSVPIALRQNTANAQRAETWYPSRFPEADEDLLGRLTSLYQNDTALNQNLATVIAQKENPNMQMQEKQSSNFAYLAKKTGELLAKNDSTMCAMLEFGGWDTHNNQQGRLSRLFSQLDKGIQNLKNSLGPAWDDTLVIVNTEFGRTAAVNGTRGTDHGTASNMFFIGGGLNSFSQTNAPSGLSHHQMLGGQVHGKWPGLAKNQLFEGRDLMPTSDVRQWIAYALSQHWQLSGKQLQRVFPDISMV